MKYFLVIWSLGLALSLSWSQEMNIGILRGNTVKKVDFSYHDASYRVMGDTTKLKNILPNEYVSLRLTSDQRIELRHGVTVLGRFKEVHLRSNQLGGHLRVHAKEPQLKLRRYQGNFKITVGEKGLTIINVVDMNDYLSGVVESEGGGGKHLEYYKAQAVISRTYALKHLSRHKKEGFALCDEVHCQAYHNALRFTPDIRTAVEQTTGIYMVDTVSRKMVDGFFHANCGGQTSSADYIWKENIPYLQPFQDTFCIHTQQAQWEKRIPKKEWRDFFVNNYFFPIQDSLYREALYSFQQVDRKIFFLSPHLGIPLKDVRYHFKLRSTFFDCYPEGEFVVLKGRGFGHGVGMCQEGAMGMANKGYDYQKILKHYFDGIDFINWEKSKFFEQRVFEPWDF